MLDRPNVGVVLAATARFFSSVKWTDEKVCKIFAIEACRLACHASFEQIQIYVACRRSLALVGSISTLWLLWGGFVLSGAVNGL